MVKINRYKYRNLWICNRISSIKSTTKPYFQYLPIKF